MERFIKKADQNREPGHEASVKVVQKQLRIVIYPVMCNWFNLASWSLDSFEFGDFSLSVGKAMCSLVGKLPVRCHLLCVVALRWNRFAWPFWVLVLTIIVIVTALRYLIRTLAVLSLMFYILRSLKQESHFPPPMLLCSNCICIFGSENIWILFCLFHLVWE